MCGLTGLFLEHPTSEILSCVQKMNQLIAHRGPDDEGYVAFPREKSSPSYCFGGADTPSFAYDSLAEYAPRQKMSDLDNCLWIGALGHRRLSIVDLSPAGHQPMCTPDRRFWITYNGEIYNHLELRRQLEDQGAVFMSNSDTEVILHAYAKWGQNCLHQFNGMFAFVIYDAVQARLFAARDRFGVKPLYYWYSPEGWLAFASEIKQFSAVPGWRAVINGQRAYDFLQWSLIDHTEETLFKGVKQVRGGEYLEVALGNLKHSMKICRWYNLPENKFHGDFQAATVMLHDLLEDAVRLRLRADVDVGSCLSGGLDSSSIVYLANRLLKAQDAPHRQKSFSACSSFKSYDERHFIDAVVKQIHLDAYYTYPALDNLWDTSKEIIWHQDEPYGSTSIYAQWQVFKLVKEAGVKVMLDGQGADEQLAGYHSFFGPRFVELWRAFRWKELLDEIHMARQIHGIKNGAQLLIDQLLPEPLRQRLRQIFRMNSIYASWIDMNKLNAEPRNPYRQNKKYHSPMQQFSYSLLFSTNLPMLLHWEDRDSMAHSVESRTPFLDYRLVEFLHGLPADYKLSKGITKRLLREGMKGILPEKIRQRTDKMAFVTPEEMWIKKHSPDVFRSSVNRAIECSQGILRPCVKEMVDEMIQGSRPFSYFIWRVICFGEWIQRFAVNLN